MLFFKKTYILDICKNRLTEADSNKYTKCMIHKRLFKCVRYSCFRWVHIKFLYNSKFDLTAKSLVTNTGAIMRVLCILECFGCLYNLCLFVVFPAVILCHVF